MYTRFMNTGLIQISLVYLRKHIECADAPSGVMSVKEINNVAGALGNYEQINICISNCVILLWRLIAVTYHKNSFVLSQLKSIEKRLIVAIDL